MRFNFKIQAYQTEAVAAVVDVFAGQQILDTTSVRYVFDKGTQGRTTASLFTKAEQEVVLGYANATLQLSKEQLLTNITTQQDKYNIQHSTEIASAQGAVGLDIEMETGTGKTYCYIKTMFELNKHYGWNKFIVVVPSIAIREGVKKSFQMMEEHFMECYAKKAHYFVYNRKNLSQLDDFATSSDLSVMIINTQAFTESFNEGKNNQYTRIIYSKRDEFGSRRPIDVIAKCRPILILDEPQKMGGDVTQKSLKQFNPLFSLYYSATHKVRHNLVYVLDALDAYNQKLVKKIEVKGFELVNLQGIDGYLYLEGIVLSPNKPPRARIELEIKQKSNIKRTVKIVEKRDDLYALSNKLAQYKGYTIADINPNGIGTVTFLNGKQLHSGEAVGNVVEQDMRRIQIRETIASHFEKEEALFAKGIKCLSLFFLDEVAHYRQYDAEGNPILGEYGKIFEEEYQRIFDSKLLELVASPYRDYLQKVASDVAQVHTGYFSIDGKGHAINSKVKRGNKEGLADDEDSRVAYDLIMRNKEQLLSFAEPVRFIFSHSALREGWDNPNIFQICTLKHSNSDINKRQEVGRGMRLCVDSTGERQDATVLASQVHDVNLLTVIASESYTDFVRSLQSDIGTSLYSRPQKADIEYFQQRTLTIEGKTVIISEQQAKSIYKYLGKYDYIDDNDKITDIYRMARDTNTLEPLPPNIADLGPAINILIDAIHDPKVLDEMIGNGKETKVLSNPLSENFYKREFQQLWQKINHKCSYRVSFASTELIEKACKAIDEKLTVTKVRYTATVGRQNAAISAHDLQQGASFTTTSTDSRVLEKAHTSSIKYDLIHELAQGTTLTRHTVVAILKGINRAKLALYKDNPEEFIRKTTGLICEEKAALTVEHISYNILEDKFEADIFTDEKNREAYNKAFKAKKHVQEYVFTDGTAAKSVERRFAEALDVAQEVVVYAKLPRGFKIPTPMGNYSPDWAIAFKEGSVQHIYFIAETKGNLSTEHLRKIERAKIDCAKKLFAKLTHGEVRYGMVTKYEELLNIVKGV